MGDKLVVPVWTRAELPTKPVHIQHMDKRALLALQIHLGLGSEWGVLQAPAAWLSPSVTSIHGTFRMTKATINNAADDAELDLAKSVFTRHVLLLLLVPSIQAEGARRHLSIGSVVRAAATVDRFLIRPALLLSPTAPAHLLNRLDVQQLPSAISFKLNADRLREMRRLDALAARGYWFDLPAANFDTSVERPRKFSLRTESDLDSTPGTHQPFTDEFIGEAGWRAAWIARNLSATVTEAAEEIRRIARSLGNQYTREKQYHRTRRQLDAFTYRDGNGTVIDKLPFGILKQKQKGKTPVWPPKSPVQIFRLLEMIQAAHLFIILLSTGGRISEVLSLREDCLTESDESPTIASGRTYKLVFAHEGEPRDWPLPALATQAVKNQIRIVALYEKVDGPRSLWCRFAPQSAGMPLSANYRKSLTDFITWLMLDHLLGEQNMRSHRFRKTIARLVALSIVEAPKVLMDIFGHKSIAMTMRYILTDPLIRAEMDTIRRELVVMFAAKAIESADTNGGPAAAPLKKAIHEAQIRTGSAWDKDDMRELAFTLTANGDHWTLVRPGVLCTKQSSQSGPCNAQKSTPDPSRCRTYCSHRLEESRARDDADRCIEQAVGFVQAAISDDNDIEKELWMGQIQAHLSRFDDVKAKWQGHPVVATLLADFPGSV